MTNYVTSMSALSGTTLWQIPHRESIVVSMALVGLACLFVAMAMLAKAQNEGQLLALRIDEE